MTIDSAFFAEKMTAYWQELGQVPSVSFRLAWEQMANAFNTHIAGQNTSKWTVLQLPTGAGKTKGLERYCSLLPEKSHPGVAIITRLTEEAKALEENINRLAGHRVAIADYHENRHQDYDIHQIPVIIVSHSAYLDAMDIAIEVGTPGFRRADFVLWKNGRRRLTVIDESLDLVKTTQFTLSELRRIRSFLPHKIMQYHAEKVTTLEQVIEKFSALSDDKRQTTNQPSVVHSDFWQVENPDYLRQLYHEIRYLPFDMLALGHKDKETKERLRKSCQDTLQAAAKLVASWGLYSRKYGEHLLTKASFVLPDEMPSAVILDATAAQNPMYEYLGSDKQQLAIPRPVRRYHNVTLHAYFNTQVGKGHLIENVKTVIPAFVKFMAERIGKQRKVLFCVPLAIESHLMKHKKRFGTDTSVGHWYALDGRNDWRDYDTIVIYGLPYLDNSVPLASVLTLQHIKQKAAESAPLLTKPLREEAAVYERQLRIVKLIQAINRIRCRKAVDAQGNCDNAEVHLFLNKQDDGERLLSGIEQQMPGILIMRHDDTPIAKTQHDRSPLGKEIFKRLKK